MKIDSFVYVFEGEQLALMENIGAITMISNKIFVMRYYNERTIRAFLKQFNLTFFVEAMVADMNDFVYKKAFELDTHRDREG